MSEQKDKESEADTSTMLLIIFLVIGIFLMIDSMDTTKKKLVADNSNWFHKNGEQLCPSSRYQYSNKYIVSKKYGWAIYDNEFFKKGDLLVYINSCEIVPNKGDK
ncbi:MAG: hypothetical protein GQ570_13300 [Helicobacteraceae bacterium]|nr:hypothetical protein [Helicobacteraceae bacterium]